MRITDAWREITPEPLQPAIEHIRDNFDDSLRIATSSDRGCHEALTAETRSLPEPVIFKQYFNLLAKSICCIITKTFTLVLQIAVKNQLEKPVDWSQSQLNLMLDHELLLSEAMSIRNWVVIACDGRYRPPPDTELGTVAEEAWLFNRDWTAPAWLHMKPLGNSFYDPAEATDRDSIERSQRVLGHHSNICAIKIESHLKRLVGQAHVQHALTAVPSRSVPASHAHEEAKEADKDRIDIREAAPGVGLPLVDMRKPAGTIARETRRAALAKGAPYRKVPDLDRILKAVEYRKKTGCTYSEASLKEFGNRGCADKIRYWHNKRAW